MSQELINHRLYQRDLVAQYAAKQSLIPAERSVLARFSEDVAGGRVLDLGCGAGRLIPHLTPLAARYVGVDVSPHMVAHCRATHRDVEIVEADMRRLDMFDDASFDTVFAIANLLDAVGHADRLRTLAEIRRVLAPGGLLVMSSHNLRWERAGEPPRLAQSSGPVEQLRNVARYIGELINRLRVRRFEEAGVDHAILNDSGHSYAVLHYYVTREEQARQLTSHDFRLVATIDESGRALAAGDSDRSASSLVYVARKA
jgi:SAM-dependent methyltransferase